MKWTACLALFVISMEFLGAQQGPPRPVSEARMETRRVTTTVGGRLQPLYRIVHKALQGGVVEEVFVNPGNRVAAGDPLFSVIQNSPGERYRPVVVTSRLSGVVSEVSIAVKEEVSQNQDAVTVLDTSTMILEAAASDLDALGLKSGIPIRGVGPDNKTYSGILSNVSTEPDYSTGLFTLTFTFPNRGDLRIGTPLFIDIPVQEVEGMFVSPQAVVRRYGRNRLWFVDDDNIINSGEVVTGSVVDGRILIVEGLAEGDRYLDSPTGREKEGMAMKDLFGSRE